MSSNQEIINNHFFVMDSNNIGDLQSRLYGFKISDEYNFTDNKEKASLYNGGCYVDVHVNEDEIIISQDFLGSYGLYYFKYDDYFALSNSLIMLVKHLNKEYELTFNKEYSEAYLFSGLCLNVYSETIIKEIKVLPRNYLIKINKENSQIRFDEIDYKENSIDINSELGIKTLDLWYDKWVKYIRNLVKNHKNVYFELSGGFDSRTVAPLWLTANIDLNNVNIVSFDEDFLREDYEIVSKIADSFNFKLNKGLSARMNNFQDENVPIDVSFYDKASFSNLMYFMNGMYDEEVYTFDGRGGETIRSYFNQTPFEYIKSTTYSVNKYDTTLKDSTRKVLERSFKLLNEKYDYLSHDSKELVELLYKETRARYHFGKSKVEDFISNNYSISPLLDPMLQQLKLETDECNDIFLLMALIITRYCPKLLEFEIEGNRSFNTDTLEYAKRINEKYPLKRNNYEFLQVKENIIEKKYDFKHNLNNKSDNKLIKILYSEAFKKDFLKLFSQESYDKVVEYSHSLGNLHMYAIVSALSSILIKKYLDTKSDKEPSEILESYLSDYHRCDFNSLVSKYYTASIDIKSYNQTRNTIKIRDVSDKEAQIYRPKYFINQNISGYSIESSTGSLKVEIECLKDMKLNIELKGLNYIIRDKKYEKPVRVPLNIDYRRFYVNKQKIFEKSLVTNHEKPYHYSIDVKKGEVIKLEIDWLPINMLSDYKRITDKTSSQILLNDMENIKIGKTTKISGKLMDLNNNIIPLAGIQLIINNGRATVRTNEEGKFEYTFEAKRVGINSITAIFKGNNTYNVSNNAINFEVLPLETELILEEIENTKLGQSTQVTGKLLDENKKIIPNATIKLLINNGRATVKTNEEGIYSYEYKTTRAGRNNIIVMFLGNKRYTQAITNAQFIVNE